MASSSSKNKRIEEKPPLTAETIEKYGMLGIFLFIMAVVVYIPVMNGGYIYDDDQLLYRNPVIQRGGRDLIRFDAWTSKDPKTFVNWESLQGLATIWYPKDKTDSADYFPVTSTSLWLEWRLWGNNYAKDTAPADMGVGAPGYHTTNILLHGICAVLLWMVFLRLGLPGAWMAALIWAVHPVGAESVAWISERKNTLSMLFFLWGMFTWLKFRRTQAMGDYLISFILILIAMLAKTAIVMVPFIILLHMWWQNGWQVKLKVQEVVEFIVSQFAILGICVVVAEFAHGWDLGGIYFLSNGKAVGGLAVLVVFSAAALAMLAWLLVEVYPRLAPLWREIVDFEGALAIFVLWCVCGYVVGGASPAMLAVFVVILTPAFFLALYWMFGRLAPQWKQTLPFFALSFVLGIVTVIFQVQRAIAEEHIPMGTIPERIAGASFALGFYLYKVLIPVNLSLIYPQWHKVPPHALEFLSPGSVGSIPPDDMHMGIGYIALLCIPALIYTAVFIWAWVRRATWGRHVIFAVGFFVINLGPILGLMKIAYLRLTLVADHFQYTAMISIIALLVATLTEIWRKEPQFREWLATIAAGFALVFSVLTAKRAWVFADPERIWKDTLLEYPDSWQAHSHMGAILYGRGDMDGAMEHWQRCVELVPYLYEVHNNYGLVLGVKGRTDEALQQYKISVGIQGNFPMLRMNYAAALASSGHFEEAAKQYEVLVKQLPDSPVFMANLGLMYFQLHRYDDAIRCLKKGIELAPGHRYDDAQRNLNIVLQKRAEELENTPPPQLQQQPQPQPAPAPVQSGPNDASTGPGTKAGATPSPTPAASKKKK